MPFVPLLPLTVTRKKHLKVYPTRMNPLVDYDDVAFYSRFRFTKTTFKYICTLVSDFCDPITFNSKSLSTELQLCIALRFFATGSFLQVIGDSVRNVSKSTVSRIINRIVGFKVWASNSFFYENVCQRRVTF